MTILTIRISEVDKRKHVCPVCGAPQGKPCRTQPRSGHGYPVPPMPLDRAHQARARLARSQAASTLATSS